MLRIRWLSEAGGGSKPAASGGCNSSGSMVAALLVVFAVAEDGGGGLRAWRRLRRRFLKLNVDVIDASRVPLLLPVVVVVALQLL